MSDLIKRLRSTRDCTVCDGDGIKDNGKECGGCDGTGKVQVYDRTGPEAADEIEMLRAGIKRLSDEEELCAETTGDDPFSMVYLSAKLAAVEAELAKANRDMDTYREYADQKSEQVIVLQQDDRRLREALAEIANSDDVDNALDPERNKRLAKATLSAVAEAAL
ncbi:hypothetical protein EPK99_06330 [Neorhizobium lilium]|uniref:Uncharacterized protein n=1 Tax=Neorhizobium lilium TaxID=2503024 RepID=A0A444LGY7_9HYPH|nr:hypothetical protein [Neorhizobium lilium]RWX78249.1 hypothetical protein EPK99_06330 [Neorhizobium lilium]